MLFDSSLRKDLARGFGATAVILITIVMSVMLIRTLGQASRGQINPQEVLMIMGFSLLSYLPMIFSLSLFISLVGSLNRMYADSEMVVWFSSGVPLFAFARPMLRFAMPVVLAVALLALFAWPWSNQQVQNLRLRFQQRNDVERIAPGQFQESASGDKVFFIDKDSPDNKSGSNVFISTQSEGTETLTSAARGRLVDKEDGQYLALERGQQVVHNRSLNTYRITVFDRQEVLIKEKPLVVPEPPARSLWNGDLVRNPTSVNLGELAWRLGQPLAALNLVLLALAIAFANPRAGRNHRLALALLLYMTYYNLINLSQNWISHGRIGMLPMMALLHLSAFAVGLIWVLARQNPNAWRFWQRSFQRSGAAS